MAGESPKTHKRVTPEMFELAQSKRRPKFARPLALVGVLFLVIGAILFALEYRRSSEERTPSSLDTDSERIEASWDAGAKVRAMVGETESMMLVVKSEPTGAMLRVDGKERGETPAGLDTRCSEEIPVVIELSVPGFRGWRRDVPCQPGIELSFDAKLVRSRLR